MKKFVITGCNGLLGRHTCIRLHSKNCEAEFNKKNIPYDIKKINHEEFMDLEKLKLALDKADYILHFAGVNRASPEVIEKSNPLIAHQLLKAYKAVDSKAHLVYANSTHYQTDAVYGVSKRKAHEIFQKNIDNYTNLIIPHIFGEGARPYYNNVTATFIDQVINNINPEINPAGKVELLHAGAVAEKAILAALDNKKGDVRLSGKLMLVGELFEHIQMYHRTYLSNIFPDLTTRFNVDLFNTYRNMLYPDVFPRKLTIHSDERGFLFEAVKGGSSGQTFLSWTEPKITRGNHFHLRKIERFIALQGEAIVRIRHVLQNDPWEYRICGVTPSVIDIPTLHTHSIENIGNEPLLTLFWTNEVFDINDTDTYADSVLKG